MPLLIGRAVASVVEHDAARFRQTLVAFAVAAAAYVIAFFLAEWLSQRLAQRVIFDIRRAMFAHFQDVSLSFMDKTHVGRIMSRLQGDVGSLQEFLESTTGSVGDFVVLIGITVVLLAMDVQLGLLTLLVLPVLIAIRAVWLPIPRRASGRPATPPRRPTRRWPRTSTASAPCRRPRREQLNFELYAEKAQENFKGQVGAAWMSGIMTPTVDVLTGLAMAVVIVVGGNAVLAGGWTSG